jgi:hypothetical protein
VLEQLFIHAIHVSDDAISLNRFINYLALQVEILLLYLVGFFEYLRLDLLITTSLEVFLVELFLFFLNSN